MVYGNTNATRILRIPSSVSKTSNRDITLVMKIIIIVVNITMITANGNCQLMIIAGIQFPLPLLVLELIMTAFMIIILLMVVTSMIMMMIMTVMLILIVMIVKAK